jgi:Putative peptidoglycan binding domain
MSGIGAEETQEHVRWYQTILKHVLGFRHLAINGDHNDPATRAALRDVQERLGLSKQTGLLTVSSNAALTQAALGRIYRDPYPAPIEDFTKELRDAVRRFQTDQEIGVDGKVGPETRARMNAVLSGMLPAPVKEFHAALALPPVSPMPPVGVPVPPSLWRPAAHVPAPPRPGSASPTALPVDPPFRWICELDATVPSTTARVRGSGVLISPRHVLTCAHNIYGDMNDDDGILRVEEVVRVSVVPACDQRRRSERVYQSKPFGTHAVARRFYDERWRKLYGEASPFDSDFDFAVLELKHSIPMSLAPRPMSGKTPPPSLLPEFGYWGFRDVERIAALIADTPAVTPEAGSERIRRIVDPDLELHSAGYPGGHGIQVRTNGFLEDPPNANVSRNTLHAMSSRDAYPDADHHIGSRVFSNTLRWHAVFPEAKGSSGSPVWVESGPRHVRTLFGINIQRPNTNRYALIALSPAVLSQIAQEFPDTFQTYVLNAPGGQGKVRGLRVRTPA